MSEHLFDPPERRKRGPIRDLAFEALVAETRSNPAMERGRINVALKAIREAAATEGITVEQLPNEIRRRAELYRQRWPQLFLTATALATHWLRIVEVRTERGGELRLLDEMREERE